MRPGTIRTWVGGFAAGLLLLTMAARCTPEAHADASDAIAFATQYGAGVCTTLDAYPSFGGLVGISRAIVETGGLSYRDAGMAIGYAVQEICPRHTGLLMRFVAVYGGKGAMA